MANTITFSRSSTTYDTLEGAKLAIVGRAINLQYGEPIVAKYKDENQGVSLLFGIGTGDFNSPVSFIGSSKDTIEVNERINRIENILGTGDINTSDKTVIGAINELLSMIEGLTPGGSITVEDTESIQSAIIEGVLKSNVKVSSTQNNAIQINSDGLYVEDKSDKINELYTKVNDSLKLIETDDNNVIISEKLDGKQSISISVIDDSNTSDPDTASDTKSLSAKATLNIIKNLDPGGEGGISTINEGDGIKIDKLSTSVTISARTDNSTVKIKSDDKSIYVDTVDGGIF
jgi:hypothetical protein